jgi:hypothetical protein
MPGQTGKSLVFQKLGNRFLQAHEAHKEDPIVPGNQGLPAGIENGIAQLSSASFREITGENRKHKGQIEFTATAICVSPEEHAGGRTSIFIPLCDTPDSKTRKTFDQNMGWLYQVLGYLGLNRTQINPQHPEAALELLVKAKPYIKFRTWKGEKQTTGKYAGQEPRVMHDWLDGTTFDPTAGPLANGAVQVDNGPPPDAPQEGEDAPDFDTLGAAADDPNDESGADEELKRLAAEYGFDWDASGLSSLATWTEVAQAIQMGPEAWAESQAEAEAAANQGPQVGVKYKFHPMNPKTKKPDKTAVEVEVVSVDEAKQTVRAKHATRPKIVYTIAFDKLESI